MRFKAQNGSRSSNLNEYARLGAQRMKVLFLSTWFPYPLDQGSRIRAYHLLRALAYEHDVSLISFEDRDIQPEWIERIGEFCRDVKTVACQPFSQPRWASALGWFSRRPRSVVGSYCRSFDEAVRKATETWSPDAVVGMTFVTAPYVPTNPGVLRVVDVDNLLARMLREEADEAGNPLERLRRHIAYRKLERYEAQLYETFDLCLVTSEDDRHAMTEYVPLPLERIAVVANGVDTRLYRADSPTAIGRTLIYPGAMTYRPNLDAMLYFIREIWSEITRILPDVTLTITGSTRGVDVSELRQARGVRFTGYVDDIRPWVAQSSACVVPLRQGAGTRLKVLEAMALGTPVVSTSKGVEGLDLEDGTEVLVADSPARFAERVIELLQNPRMQRDLSQQARRKVEQDYDWEKIAVGFRQSLNETMERVRNHAP